MNKVIGDTYILVNGDSLEFLKSRADNSVDAIVTDPPYGLGKEPDALQLLQDWIVTGHHDVKSKKGFMGKEWDAFVPQPVFWKECLRVLKPGGHILTFGGTRTYDLVTLGLRIAGFEVRENLMWVFGSGFPKSHDISKAIDKMAGVEREVIGIRTDGRGKSPQKILNHGKGDTGIGHADGSKQVYEETVATSIEAKQWSGYGSALKPAYEPIVMARKPLEKGLTLAENVLKWGTGGINIDGCRVETDEIITNHSRGSESAKSKGIYGNSVGQETHQTVGQQLGRFPANLIISYDEDTYSIKGDISDEQRKLAIKWIQENT